MNVEFAIPGRVRAAIIDDLLPVEIASEIFGRFPSAERMSPKISIKERKHVGVQMDAFDPLIEEVVYAFQDRRVVTLIGEITGLKALEPDAELYAGGISLMSKGGYLRPHLDNSHDGDRRRYRVLNLLYYVTPGWSEEQGGCLQLWDRGPTGEPRTVPSLFNRLVVMATDHRSWHSVSDIVGDRVRCCVSNYYFSTISPGPRQYFHATSFRSESRSRPLVDLLMRVDNGLRTAVLKWLPGTYRNPHTYQRRDQRARPPAREIYP
jgi:Rps23 Pro-64 3,4-dihydroxylase Tpa1-like proline 4-hydroxylase